MKCQRTLKGLTIRADYQETWALWCSLNLATAILVNDEEVMVSQAGTLGDAFGEIEDTARALMIMSAVLEQAVTPAHATEGDT
jgi:hypothetical protein